MFLATGEARFVDVVELALYNGVLSGVGLDGTNFFYTNPLRVTDPMPVELRWSRARVPFVSSFCCPPNLLRTIAESSSYAYAKSSNTIWVNLYGASTLTTKLAGQTVKLTQETEYPWSGRVRIVMNECAGEEFALKLRVPGWAKGVTIRSSSREEAASDSGKNQNLASAAKGNDGYVELRRVWTTGDIIDLDLPMSPRLMEANPLVEETLNQIAVQRGPIVYCLESVDLPRGTRISDILIPADIDLIARFDRRLLGGVVILEGLARARPNAQWDGELYREVQRPPTVPIKVGLVPYAVWANRGPGEMSVWLPCVHK